MQIKEIVKRICVKQLDRAYEKQLTGKKVSYHNWVCYKEEKLETAVSSEIDSFVVLCQKRGSLNKKAEDFLAEYFEKFPQAQLLYGDEDFAGADGKRGNPWYKPAWSPDTYLSQFYPGSVVAVRKSVWDRCVESLPQWKGTEKQSIDVPVEKSDSRVAYVTFEASVEIRDLVDRMIEGLGGFEKGCRTIYRVPQVLFHVNSEEVWKDYLATASMRTQRQQVAGLVSVIIPSKDNVEVLETCLDSLKGLDDIEIILVDNGSSRENRTKIEGFIGNGRYLYHPMEFNFSEMCNMGAREAKGEYLLFLNDDIEACGQGWLTKMKSKAAEDYVGAVGLKLYYPRSNKLQHAGIINLPVGPVHKMQFAEDEGSYYFDRNKGVWNCLAVTGACLLIKTEKYWEVGGLKSSLQVAYNDVELGFALYEAGYQNVVILDEYAYHHESLSRGDDVINSQKRERLLRERATLYELHPLLQGVDPYYAKELSQDGLDSRIVPGYYEANNMAQKATLQPCAYSMEELREDKCLMINVEQSRQGFIKGYGVVLGDDNACYDTFLVLSKETRDLGQAKMIKTIKQYRQDLEENMPDQKNVALCGFEVELPMEELSAEYYIGVIAVHKLSKLKLINWSGWQVRGKK